VPLQSQRALAEPPGRFGDSAATISTPQSTDVHCIFLGIWLTCLPGNVAADAAAKETALLENLTSGRALGSDVGAHLHRAVLSSSNDEQTQSTTHLQR
jgi:hypothetical protein